MELEELEADPPELQREEAVAEALETLIDRLNSYIEASHLQRDIWQQAVVGCLTSCVRGIEMLYINREDTSVSNVSLLHNSWDPDPEPVPCAMDSWLRAALPEEMRAAPARVRPRSPGKPAVRDSMIRRSCSGAGTSIAGSENQRNSPSVRGRVPNLARVRSSGPGAASGQPHGGSSRPDSPVKSARAAHKAAGSLSAEEQLAEDRLREELEIRRQQQAVAQQMRVEDSEARAKLAALTKTLGHKEYSYDHKGNVIVVSKVGMDSLPPDPTPGVKTPLPTKPTSASRPQRSLAAAAALKVNGDGDAATATGRAGAPSATAKRPGDAPAATMRTAGTVVNGTKSRPPPTDFQHAPSRSQPSAMETLKPSSGVTLKQGAASKSGPPKQKSDHPGQLSRSEFKQTAAQILRAQASATAVAAAATAGGAGARSAAGVRPSIKLQLTASPSSKSMSDAAAAAAAAAGGAAGQQPEKHGTLTGAGADSRKAGSSSSPLQGKANSNGGGAAAGKPKPGSITQGAAGDVNLLLTSSPDWGASAAGSYAPPEGLPKHKPAPKQIEQEVGRSTHMPKTRANIATIKPPVAADVATGKPHTLRH